MAHLPCPDDLARAQREWARTYAALAVPDPRRYTALRRRLLRLSTQIASHPFLTGSRSPGPYLVELRRHLRDERSGSPGA